MKKIIEKINNTQIKKGIKKFRVGDLIEVKLWVFEGNKKRIQSFEGIVIALHNNHINSTFTIRKISYGEGVERVFMLHSPIIDNIILKRQGRVRKSKLYYIRKKYGKSARIKELI